MCVSRGGRCETGHAQVLCEICCNIHENRLVSSGHKRRQSSENFGEFQAGKINLVVISGSRAEALSGDETNQRKAEEGEKMVEGRS